MKKQTAYTIIVNLVWCWIGFCFAWGIFHPTSLGKIVVAFIGGLFGFLILNRILDGFCE